MSPSVVPGLVQTRSPGMGSVATEDIHAFTDLYAHDATYEVVEGRVAVHACALLYGERRHVCRTLGQLRHHPGRLLCRRWLGRPGVHVQLGVGDGEWQADMAAVRLAVLPLHGASNRPVDHRLLHEKQEHHG